MTFDPKSSKYYTSSGEHVAVETKFHCNLLLFCVVVIVVGGLIFFPDPFFNVTCLCICGAFAGSFVAAIHGIKKRRPAYLAPFLVCVVSSLFIFLEFPHYFILGYYSGLHRCAGLVWDD